MAKNKKNQIVECFQPFIVQLPRNSTTHHADCRLTRKVKQEFVTRCSLNQNPSLFSVFNSLSVSLVML